MKVFQVKATSGNTVNGCACGLLVGNGSGAVAQ